MIVTYLRGAVQRRNSGENLKAALTDSSVKPDIQFHRINEEEAKRKGLMGSPTVLINGIDILPGEMPGMS